MQVEQIIYGSANRSRMKGYQIIGKSPGVDAALASEFCKWAPSHNSLEMKEESELTDAWGLSCFALPDYRYAIARSIHGGPEYSGRGGFAVVTNALVLTRKQLQQFAFDALAVARTAITLGQLILQVAPEEELPQVALPSQAINMPAPQSDFADSSLPILPSHAVSWVAREARSLLGDNRKVMIVGDCDPLPILAELMEESSSNERSQISFACGLKPSNRRDFRLQFTYQPMSHKLQRELERSGTASIDLARVLIETT